MKSSKKITISIIISVIILSLIAFDLNLGNLKRHGKYSYSAIRHLHCITVKGEEYAHISPDSVYSSSGDYVEIYQCGDEYDRTTPAG